MKFLIFLVFMSVNLFTNPLVNNNFEELKKELGIHINEEPTRLTCTVYLIHHGSTKWSEEKRLQGWQNVELSEKGKEEIHTLANKISSSTFSAIYVSDLQSGRETGEILQETLKCPLFEEFNFRGEHHGSFEGKTKEEYTQHPHFLKYDALDPEEELFSPCGEGGLSKAETVFRVIPAIKKVASENLEKNIAIVTHGGVFKTLNFYLIDQMRSISHGDAMIVEANEDGIYLKQ